MINNLDNKININGNNLRKEDSCWCLILCNTPDKDYGNVIAKSLLANKIAACVTLLTGSTSLYYWHGTLENKSEVQLIIKTHTIMQEAVFTHIKSYHPYKTPELLVLPVTNGEPDYLLWLKDALL